jgi:hypothetical protein
MDRPARRVHRARVLRWLFHDRPGPGMSLLSELVRGERLAVLLYARPGSDRHPRLRERHAISKLGVRLFVGFHRRVPGPKPHTGRDADDVGKCDARRLLPDRSIVRIRRPGKIDESHQDERRTPRTIRSRRDRLLFLGCLRASDSGRASRGTRDVLRRIDLRRCRTTGRFVDGGARRPGCQRKPVPGSRDLRYRSQRLPSRTGRLDHEYPPSLPRRALKGGRITTRVRSSCYSDGARFSIVTNATRFTPLQARTRFPSGVAIMFRTTPPPDGMVQV